MEKHNSVRWVAIIASIFLALFLGMFGFSLSNRAGITEVKIGEARIINELKYMNQRLDAIYDLLELRIRGQEQ